MGENVAFLPVNGRDFGEVVRLPAIFASKYETVLPSKEALQKLLNEQTGEVYAD